MARSNCVSMMLSMDRSSPQDQTPRKRPSRTWYLVSAVVMLASLAVFVFTVRAKSSYLHGQIEPMPRFAAPTGEDGTIVSLDARGKHNLFYENRGSLEGKTYDTPRRQIWTTYASPSMTCTVTHVETGVEIEVRLPGQSDAEAKSKTSKDQIVAYDLAGMQGHSAWVFDVDQPGDYRIVLTYDEAVYLEPGEIEIPPELTKQQKKEMLSADGEAYEAARRTAIEKALLTELKPVDVLFAVGPDPTVNSFFNVIGLKGAASVLAFGFTFAALTSLVTLMLRGGHVTPRGETQSIKRLGEK